MTTTRLMLGLVLLLKVGVLRADETAVPRSEFRPEMAVTREVLRIWLLCTLAGVAVGIMVGMLFGRDTNDDYWRVGLETSVPLALLGGLLGNGLGFGLSVVYKKFPGTRPFISVLCVVLLATSIGATTGWVDGSCSSRNYWEHEQRTRVCMAVGACLGLLLGLVLATAHEIRRPPTRGHCQEASSSTPPSLPGNTPPGQAPP